MSRPLSFIVFIFIISMAFFGVFMTPKTSLAAPVPMEPEFPVCSEGSQEVLQFGSGVLSRPNALEANFNFNVPAGAGPEGQVLVWQGEGHLWDNGCEPGAGNDDASASCDQNQEHEIIIFTVNADVVGQFVDHSSDPDPSNQDDINTFYEFDFDNLVEGSNQLDLHHLNEGTGANSVFYKGVVCAVTAPTSDPLEGCTPGFWKNHPAAWEAAGYSTSQTVQSVFNVPDEFDLNTDTLLEALRYGGGAKLTGAAKILLRAAVAALLNAANPDIDYPRTGTEIISAVNTALSSKSRNTMLALATQLDTDNNLGCPINGK